MPENDCITAADFPQNLTWVPGHFGALANQPWICGLQFQQFAPAPGDAVRELFMLAYECAPFYVRSQVINASGPFRLVSTAYLGQMESMLEWAQERWTSPSPLTRSQLSLALSRYLKCYGSSLATSPACYVCSSSAAPSPCSALTNKSSSERRPQPG